MAVGVHVSPRVILVPVALPAISVAVTSDNKKRGRRSIPMTDGCRLPPPTRRAAQKCAARLTLNAEYGMIAVIQATEQGSWLPQRARAFDRRGLREVRVRIINVVQCGNAWRR